MGAAPLRGSLELRGPGDPVPSGRASRSGTGRKIELSVTPKVGGSSVGRRASHRALSFDWGALVYEHERARSRRGRAGGKFLLQLIGAHRPNTSLALGRARDPTNPTLQEPSGHRPRLSRLGRARELLPVILWARRLPPLDHCARRRVLRIYPRLTVSGRDWRRRSGYQPPRAMITATRTAPTVSTTNPERQVPKPA